MLRTAALLIAGLALVNAASFDQTTGIRNQYYAAATYCKANLENWNCGRPCNNGPKLSEITIIQNAADATFGYVGYNSATNEIVVAFRGSADIQNWITNLEFVQCAYPSVYGAKVHHGFYAAYLNMEGQMLSAIQNLRTKHASAGIDVTGHSLGAAFATFAAVAIKRNYGFSSFTFYTFGSPRVGNQAFSDYVFSQFPNGLYQRVTHYNDVVPHVAPHFLSF